VAVTRKGRCTFLLWYTNEVDGLLTDGAASLRTFASTDEARAYAASSGLKLDDSEVAAYDLDDIEAWTDDPEHRTLHWDMILNAWNLLADVSRSVGNQVATARLLDRATFPAYDRLVNSCELPALGSRPAVGELTEGDRRAIAAVLRHGLLCFDDAIALSKQS
jgi:hypothetical protein